ncbi:hypothetical protein GCM10008968_17130 [Bacillus horti]
MNEYSEVIALRHLSSFYALTYVKSQGISYMFARYDTMRSELVEYVISEHEA